MKRDMELVRSILIKIEEDSNMIGNLQHMPIIEDYSEKEIHYHLGLLKEAGFIDAEKRPQLDKNYPILHPKKLTWAGHEFLDNARNDAFWKKAINRIASKGETVSINVLQKLLTQIALETYGIP